MESSSRVQLTPVHLVRAGSGLDAVHLRVRGSGLLVGTFGVRWVRRGLDTVMVRRFASGRCWALFLGPGPGWASVRLPAAVTLDVPRVEHVDPPRPAPVVPAPSVTLQLAITPPEPP